MYIRIKDQGNPENAVSLISKIMRADDPAYPFDYKFVDEEFNQLFLSEMLVSKLSRVFAVLAIIISCLGLFGLAAYTAERRTKEISIRKVLGASAFRIAGLLSEEFMALMVISSLLAFPIAWFAMYTWLQNYAYHINIKWWVFASAGITALLIAIITISYQAIKAAVSSPIKSLRAGT